MKVRFAQARVIPSSGSSSRKAASAAASAGEAGSPRTTQFGESGFIARPPRQRLDVRISDEHVCSAPLAPPHLRHPRTLVGAATAYGDIEHFIRDTHRV